MLNFIRRKIWDFLFKRKIISKKYDRPLREKKIVDKNKSNRKLYSSFNFYEKL